MGLLGRSGRHRPPDRPGKTTGATAPADMDGIDFAAALAERARRAGADAAQAAHVDTEQFELDADTGGVNLVATKHGDSTTLTVFRDERRGAAELTGRDEAAVDAAIRNALDTADAARPDPANAVAEVRSAPPSRHGPEQADRNGMLAAVRDYLDGVRVRFPLLRVRHAIYTFEDRRRSFANTAGAHRQERRGIHRFGTMFGAKDGTRSTSFNYAGASAWEPFQRLVEAGAVESLIADTMRSFDPRPVPEKFIGDVILTPSCTASIAGTLARALDGYALMGGLTPYAGREGQTIASPAFSLLNRPADARFPDGADFDDCGVATRNVDVIRNGTLETFLVDFFCSRKLGRRQNAGRRTLVIPPGERGIDDLIRETERGIVLARFSGGVPNHKLDFSGVAKNSFYVEDGEIRYPLIETMASGNFQDLLMNIRGVSSESTDFGGGAFPYLAASGVTISRP